MASLVVHVPSVANLLPSSDTKDEQMCLHNKQRLNIIIDISYILKKEMNSSLSFLYANM